MFRPTGFADLAGRRVGIFGYGVEGHAAARRLEGLARTLVVVDDAPGIGPDVLMTSAGGLDALLGCDIVLKSPGIPRRRADVLDLEHRGVTVTSALNLWLHDVDRARVVGITGTKGKSTTTALVSFFLHCLDEESQCLGNIGQPPYDPTLDTSTGWLVLELSSFQCVDLEVAPGIVVVTSLGADHLDWHGSLQAYRDDKLSLTRAFGEHLTLVPDDETMHAEADRLGGELHFVPADTTHLAAPLGLMGAHSDSNVALALGATARLTRRDAREIRERVAARAHGFEPLPGRLSLVTTEVRHGTTVRYVDDGLATSVLPAVAALEVFADDPVALIAGGFDRGVDYVPLAAAIARRSAGTMVLTMGDAGARVADALARLRPDVPRRTVTSMREAVNEGRRYLRDGGVVLLSPGAPSFDRYRNWEERSDDFVAAVREATQQWSLGGDSNS